MSASGGTSPYTYTITGGSPPSGLGLSGGAISGIPSAAGPSSFTVTATDTNGYSGSASCSITVVYPVVTPVCPSSSAGVYYAYSSSASASGGSNSGFTYSIASGGLPTGLSLTSSTGLVSGTPTTVQTSSFTLGATDSAGNSGTASCSIVVGCRTGGENCGSGNNCCSGLSCVGGSCTQTVTCKGIGEACTGTYTSSNCCSTQGSSTLYCSNSVCTTCISRGASCGSSSQCCSGNMCIGGTCACLATGYYGNTYGGCSGMSCCSGKCDAGSCYDCIATGSATSCTFNSDCCSNKCSGTTCVNYWPNGHSCTSGADCSSSLCSGGVCVASLPNGASCTGDSECTSGICSIGSNSQGTCASCYADIYNQCQSPVSKCCANSCMPKPTKPSISVCGLCVGFGSTCDFDSECCSGYKCSTSSWSCVANFTLSCPYSSATVGTPYTSYAGASGGSGSYSWSASGLPSGLSIAPSTGLVSGTPTTVGSPSYTITVTDSQGSSASQSCSMTVACAGTGGSCSSASQCCSSICSSNKCVAPLVAVCPSSTATANSAYSSSITMSGGTGMMASGSMTGGALPSGITSSGASFSGTPSAVGSSSFTIQVTDTGGNSATGSCTISVTCAATGASCASASQCCSAICTGGICGCSAQPDGSSCSKGFQCCSGVCNSGVCGTNIA